MPATLIECDHCGIETKEFVASDDGVFCHKCDLEDRLRVANDAYDNKVRWLADTHLKELDELEKEIEALRLEVNDGQIIPGKVK